MSVSLLQQKIYAAEINISEKIFFYVYYDHYSREKNTH